MRLSQAELWVDHTFDYWLDFTFDFKFCSLVTGYYLMSCRQTVEHSQQERAETLAEPLSKLNQEAPVVLVNLLAQAWAAMMITGVTIRVFIFISAQVWLKQPLRYYQSIWVLLVQLLRSQLPSGAAAHQELKGQSTPDSHIHTSHKCMKNFLNVVHENMYMTSNLVWESMETSVTSNSRANN